MSAIEMSSLACRSPCSFQQQSWPKSVIFWGIGWGHRLTPRFSDRSALMHSPLRPSRPWICCAPQSLSSSTPTSPSAASMHPSSLWPSDCSSMRSRRLTADTSKWAGLITLRPSRCSPERDAGRRPSRCFVSRLPWRAPPGGPCTMHYMATAVPLVGLELPLSTTSSRTQRAGGLDPFSTTLGRFRS